MHASIQKGFNIYITFEHHTATIVTSDSKFEGTGRIGFHFNPWYACQIAGLIDMLQERNTVTDQEFRVFFSLLRVNSRVQQMRKISSSVVCIARQIAFDSVFRGHLSFRNEAGG